MLYSLRLQDNQRSESLNAGAELLRLNRLVRPAVGLMALTCIFNA